LLTTLLASAPSPPTQKAGSYTHYIANIRSPKHLFGQTYRVHIFLGPFDTDTATWHTQDALVGTFVSLGRSQSQETGGCGKCKTDAEENLMITGTVPLTAALLKEFKKGNLGSVEKQNVIPYLKENLHWRVTLVFSIACLAEFLLTQSTV